MRISDKIIGTFILVIILSALPTLFVNSNTSNNETVPLNSDSKMWTVLIYMCGDNNLEYFALEDLNQMEASGGTSEDVNIIVMFDRCEQDYETPEYPNDWSETRYFEIQGDSNPLAFTSPMLLSLGEENMGDPQSLDDFINWGMTNYPSEKKALIIWDHGNGLDGVCWDEDNGDDNLLVNEISTALNGYYFDFLGFDACHMGQFEVMYELKDYCEIYTASLLNEPGSGWDYYETFMSLLATPSMTADVLAQNACEDYVDFYNGYDVDVTLSAYNTSKFDDIDSLIDNFANEMITSLPTYIDDIFNARITAYSDLFPDIQCEMKEFLDNLLIIPEITLANSITALNTRLDEILVVSESSFTVNPYGLWLFIPAVPYQYFNDFYIFSNQSVVDSYYNYYYDLDIVINTEWENFLFQWKEELETFLPEVSISSPVTDTLTDGTYTYLYADLLSPGLGYAYLATLTMTYSVDFDLYLWSEEYHFGLPNGFELYSTNEIAGNPESILIIINAPTRVFFLVRAYSGTGSFTLKLETVEYNDDAYEENDDIFNAAPITVNTEYLLISNDADFFSVTLSSAMEIDIYLIFNYDIVDLDLYLLDSEGEPLDYSNSWDNNEYINFVTTYTGIYYIWVDHYDLAFGETYSLEIDVSEDPVITNLYHSPTHPDVGETITIYCYISSLYSISEVTLSVSYDGGETQYFTMTFSGTYYSIEINPPSSVEIVSYSVYVEDSQGNHVESITKYISIDTGSKTNHTATLAFPWIFVPLMLLSITIIYQQIFLKKRK